MRHIAALLVLLLSLLSASCVNVDPETGKTIPRGNQKYEYAKVKQKAEGLKVGMTRLQVLTLLGSPAETHEGVWLYLPERPGILLPSSALRLEFEGQVLRKHEYRTIILGQRL